MGFKALLLFFLSVFAPIASAEFVMSAPPREDPAQAQRLYGPLASELGRIVGDKVVFQSPESWADYSHQMHDGKYDFVLDGPHFVAWRMAHTGHVPLVRLQGKLGYTVFVHKEGPASLRELRFQKICSMPSPNLAAVVLLNQFDPYAAPDLVAPRDGGVKGSFEAFQEGKCLAVVLPSYFSERLRPEKTAGLRKLFTSRDMPNLALTVGPRVPAQMRSAIIAKLTDPKTEATLKPLLENLAGKGNGTFVPANAADYAGNEKLLEGVVWGW